MKIYQLVIVGLIMTLLPSCEETIIEIPPISNECSDKVLLIEELSGVSCPNCPKGTTALNEILAIFPGKVVAYAIHGDFLAEPKSGSKYDFRTSEGAAQEQFLEPWRGKPAAAIDRFKFTQFDQDPDGTITSTRFDSWLSLVEDRCQTPQSLNLIIESDYDMESRTSTIVVTATGVLPLPGELRMNVVISESHLIDLQDAGPDGIIEDYEHNHIMKERLSELTGDFFINDLSIDQTISKTYSYTVPDEVAGEWIPENMEITAFVTEGGQQRGVVLQAAQEQLVQP